MGTGGVGSAPHLYGELFKMMTGVELVTVNYRGAGLALLDLISGQVQVTFDVVISAIEHIRAGKFTPLGLTPANGLTALPDVPPIRHCVPGYDATTWHGPRAPATPPPQNTAI